MGGETEGIVAANKVRPLMTDDGYLGNPVRVRRGEKSSLRTLRALSEVGVVGGGSGGVFPQNKAFLGVAV